MIPSILQIKEKELNETIYDLGALYEKAVLGGEDNSLALLISNKKGVEEKLVNSYVINFLKEIGYLTEDLKLSKNGQEYYYNCYIYPDETSSKELMKQCVLKNSIVNFLVQVFYGRGKINKVQLCDLLNHHNVSEELLTPQNITSILVFLNKYNIITYDKRAASFYVNEDTYQVECPKEIFIEPTIPFSNIYNIRKVIRKCEGNIFWIDKHFRKEGFEILIDSLNNENVKKVTIISGDDNFTSSAQNDFKLLRQELLNRNIVLDWKIIRDNNFKLHDRWLIADNIKYNIPPVLAIIRGQRSEILETDIEINLDEFINNSIEFDVITNKKSLI